MLIHICKMRTMLSHPCRACSCMDTLNAAERSSFITRYTIKTIRIKSIHVNKSKTVFIVKVLYEVFKAEELNHTMMPISQDRKVLLFLKTFYLFLFLFIFNTQNAE